MIITPPPHIRVFTHVLPLIVYFSVRLFTMPCLDTTRVTHLAVVPGFNKVPVALSVFVTSVGVIFIVPIIFVPDIYLILLRQPLPVIDVVHIFIFLRSYDWRGG